MRGLKKFFLAALSLCALGLCMGNAEAVAAAERDFTCTYSANPDGLLGGYASSAVNVYTAAEAAEEGIPAGYENEVLEVVSSGSSCGVVLDFSAEQVPLGLIDGLQFRVYVGLSDKNTNTNYPQLRIPDPNGSGDWVYQKNVAITTGEWTTFTMPSASSFALLCEDGKLNKFVLNMRSQGTVDFYIDSISYVLKANDGVAPVITHEGGDTISVALGKALTLSASAVDAQDGEVAVEYIWDEGVALNEKGTPALPGTYNLTLKAVDYYGNVATKKLTAEVIEGDTSNPEIAVSVSEVKTTVGAKPMLSVTATDNSGNVTLTKTWSEGALDKRGRLTAGEHTWTLTASDLFGNTTTKTVRFIVTAEEPAYSYVVNEGTLCGDHTVTFDGKNPIVVPHGFKVGKPADPTKEATAEARYNFIGWYVDGKAWDFDNDVVLGDLDIQSEWEVIKRVYTVSFNGTAAHRKVEYGSVIPADFIPEAPTKQATFTKVYTFAGWYLGDKLWDFEKDVVTGDTALKAKFEEGVRYYKVTFDGENEQQCAYGAKVVEPQTPEKAPTATCRYEFIGWFNGNNQWNFETDTVKWNTSLQSKWKEIEIKVDDEKPSDSTEKPDDSTADGSDDANPVTKLLAGCSGMVGGLTAGIVAMGIAAVALIKKKED